MIGISSIDMRGYESLIYGLRDALASQGGDGDLSHVIRDESRHLSMEIQRKMGPKTVGAGTKAIRKDVKQQFAPIPKDTFTEAQSGGGHTRWLYAGPDYLVGVNREDFKPDIDEASIHQAYKRIKSNVRGNAYLEAMDGKFRAQRGRQHVMILNRIVVLRKTLAALIRRLSGRVGRMRATIAFTAHMFGESRIPQWISRHFDGAQSSGKAIFEPSELNNGDAPSITFGSRSPGVARYSEEVAEAVETRKHKLRARIKRILSGYADDAKSGRRVRKKAAETQSFSE